MKLDLQEFIFDNKPTRKQLLDYSASQEKRFKICVYRNHSFELVENTITAYLDYAQTGAEFVYSDYDDSLSFLELPESDMLILWLDISRYKSSTEDFINERLSYLSGIYSKPVLFVPFLGKVNVTNDRVTVYDMTDISEQLGERFTDARMEPYTGTKMSAQAISLAARRLGLEYIPSLLTPALKAVVVDLDNTLYKGVLGEDGIDGIELTKGHARLQQKLHELSESGFFICVASKNDERDVEEMFAKREDFPLKRSDLSKLCVTWNSKAQSMGEIAQYLNIGSDSILFIDDNPGEINAVLSSLPLVHTIRAYDDADKTLEVLNSYPRMKKLSAQKEDSLRKDDIIANEQRRALQKALTGDDYIRSLEMKLTFAVDCADNAPRTAELSCKTNQFIFNYMRYQLPDVQRLMNAPDSTVVTVSLSDKLSDSGIIGVCCAVLRDDTVFVEECFVSCRALGRGIDESIVCGAIELACRRLGGRKVSICFRQGERNLPAEQFLEKNFGTAESPVIENFRYVFPEDLIEVTIKEN